LPEANEALEGLREEIQSFRYTLRAVSMGSVTDVDESIVRISGLRNCMVGEVIRVENGVQGMVLNLEDESVGAVVLGPHAGILEGSNVTALGRVMAVPVGMGLLGRVVNPLGEPLDRKGVIAASGMRVVEQVARGIIERAPVTQPLYTGIKAVDALVPIGRGQRELIIGDRQTGKTTLAIDAIINQARDKVLCVYVAIGQKLSSVARVVDTLAKHGALEHTAVVVAEASAPAALQYLAPYVGCAIAEALVEQGRDTLIVYDDLTKHAWAYRQISLLLRRPPGREAYPGDIFYLHARLLERAGRYGEAYGGGSMTALPIVETQLGDMSAYIPTNIISITDGQLFLETELFNAGVRPAVNAGLSVSRVASAAQSQAMRQVAGQIRLDLAQYRELVSFTQFGTDLDAASQAALDRGARLLELIKQEQHVLIEPQDQVAVFFAAGQGYLNDVTLEEVPDFERRFIRYMQQEAQGVRNAIVFEQRITPEIEQRLRLAVERFRETVWRRED
jgi:F-type H+/Na+-transporting ATPase subunit alpha